MRITKKYSVCCFVLFISLVAYAAIEDPRLHYLNVTWVPERIASQEGNPRKVTESEVFTEKIDVNSDGLSDYLISNKYSNNGKAGLIWDLYVAHSAGTYRRERGTCFHRLGAGAFSDSAGVIYSCWPGSAEEGSLQSHKWVGEEWKVETVARYKRNENFKTVLTTSSGESYVVEDNDGLIDKMKEIFLSEAPESVGTRKPEVQADLVRENQVVNSESSSVPGVSEDSQQIVGVNILSDAEEPPPISQEKNGSSLWKFLIPGLVFIGGGIVFGYRSRKPKS